MVISLSALEMGEIELVEEEMEILLAPSAEQAQQNNKENNNNNIFSERTIARTRTISRRTNYCVLQVLLVLLAFVVIVGVVISTTKSESESEFKFKLKFKFKKRTNRTNHHPTTLDDRASLTTKQLQIANYIRGTALALTVHITHHAGTALCHMMRNFGSTPDFACMGKGHKGNETGLWPVNTTERFSWPYNDTASNVKKIRPHFHFISWEYVNWANLHDTNWEYENLVSMIPMRDPLDRFLAGGKCGPFHTSIPADPTNITQGVYWEYANSECANNYALRVLANTSDCANGLNTSLGCLESAKNLLRRFTFILDQACLEKSEIALGQALHLNITASTNPHPGHPPARERLNNDTLYEFLRHQFRRDIELYEWSKTQSIVQC